MAHVKYDAKSVRTLKQKLLLMIGKSLTKTHTIIISSKLLSDPDLYAEVDRHGGLLLLNPSIKRGGLDEFIASFIHECLHVFLKTGCDKIVCKMEKAIYADMSAIEKQNLFDFLAKNATWDE